MASTAVEYSHRLEWREDMSGAVDWVGQRTFTCPDGSMPSELIALRHAEYPGTFDVGGTPICMRAAGVRHPRGIGKQSLLIAQYETRREDGKARLFARTSGRTIRILREPEGDQRIIEGIDTSGDYAGQVEWVITEGDNTRPSSETILQLSTAYQRSGFVYSSTRALAGTCNDASGSLMGIVDFDEHQMLCEGVAITGVFGDELVYVEYFLRQLAEGESWFGQVYSQPGTWMPKSRAIYDDDDADSGAVATQMEFQLGKVLTDAGWQTVSPSARNPVREADWSSLNGLATW
jgi:hypothetical protein